MLKSITIATTLLALFANSSEAQTEPQELACGRQLEDGSGQARLVTDPALHILELTRAEEFSPPAPPLGTTLIAFFCLRSDIVPAKNDWKVFQAGGPFLIIADINGERRMLVLEMENGRLRARTPSITLSDADRERLTAFLNEAQQNFYKK
jgi:hypothetical protein